MIGTHWQKFFGWDESVVMDNAKIGNECIIGALSFVPTGFISENRELIVGSPAKILREISDEMIAWKTKGTAIYQELAREGHIANSTVRTVHRICRTNAHTKL